MPLVTPVMHPVMYGGIEAGLLTLLNMFTAYRNELKISSKTKKGAANSLQPLFSFCPACQTPPAWVTQASFNVIDYSFVV